MKVQVPCANASCTRIIYIGEKHLKPVDLKYCKPCKNIQYAMAVHAKGDLN